MALFPSHRRAFPLAWGLSLALGLALAAPGCALLIPSSWRGHAPVPLSGPIEAGEPGAGDATAEELAELSDERLLAMVEADEQRLVELASAPDEPALSPEAADAARNAVAQELREIGDRLPLAQHELELRGVGRAGARIQHPVIQ